MTDCFAGPEPRTFSPGFERLLGQLVSLGQEATKLPRLEAQILSELITGFLRENSKSPEIPLTGLTETGVKRLEQMLRAHGIATTLIPMQHHYRAASEPARLMLST